LIALYLIDSDQDNVVGCVRAQKFIEDFNKYLFDFSLSNIIVTNAICGIYGGEEGSKFFYKVYCIADSLEKKRI